MAIIFTSSFSSIAGTFLGDFQTEDSARPHELSEYYRGGDFVPDSAQYSDIPTSGTISVSDFGFATSTLTFQVTIDTNINNVFLDSYATANGWNGNDILEVTINPDVIIGAATPDRTTAGFFIRESAGDLDGLRGLPALTIDTNNTIINNYGIIHGYGGTGGGFAKLTESASTFSFLQTGQYGGSAIEVTGNNVEIRNYDRILGGGGGGGFGRGVGASPTIPIAGGGGGAGAGRPGAGSTNLNQTGGVQYDAYSSTPARGGGDGASWGVTTARIYSGEYGGLDFTSTGFNDGTDGSITYYGGGGGGWGRPGRLGNDRGFPSAAGIGGYSVDATGFNVELQTFHEIGAISAGDLEGNVDSETGVITTINVANGVYDNTNIKSYLPGAPSGGYPELDLYELAQSSGGLTPVSGKIEQPIKFVIDATTRVRNIDIGGKFSYLVIENNGMIFGEGGRGSSTSGNSGAPGIQFSSNDVCDTVLIINNSGGYIAGGGDGGQRVIVGSGLQGDTGATAPGGGGAGGGQPGISAQASNDEGTSNSTGFPDYYALGSITGAGSNGNSTADRQRGTNLVGGVTVGSGGQAGGGGGVAAAACRQVSGPDDQTARASMSGGGGAVFPAGTTGANGGGGANLLGLGSPNGQFGYAAATAGAGGSFGDANAISGTGSYVTNFSYVNNGTIYGAIT